MRLTGRTVIVATVSALLALSIVSSAPGADRPRRDWFTSWAESQQGLAAVTLENQSVRMITHLSQGGDAIRVRLQNTFGTTPLTIDRTTAGHSSGQAAVTDVRPVTFGGRRSITIPPGGDVWSDPTGLVTNPDSDLAVSTYASGRIVPGRHDNAFRNNYVTASGAGEHTGDPAGTAYTRTVTATYLVSAVDVHNPALQGTIVPFGSSVVDGTGSTNCGPGCTETGTNRRWSDDLARRITAELPPGQRLAVANAGIAGTTSSPDCPQMPAVYRGLDAATRLDRDVLALHGVTGVIYYYGTNDLADGCTAVPILDSYRQVFSRLREAGIAVYLTPITSRPGYTDQNNRDRYTVGTFVKQWNNCAGSCDGVVDFDQVLKDPLKPNAINPAYDNGDGIHANIPGQQALADYVSLAMLRASRW
ncbi:GDSL-type esterase/lipase family protein [Amycolatopsis sp.]|uniref:GDSL-type esterase/lipase family protein n=1 Tax=Amycolatopsis sp. TaxID=37632 RepID=UPI00260A1BC6|nr:GDSL-type esterase/lipase family protein [Amycolatopsis sp.]